MPMAGGVLSVQGVLRDGQHVPRDHQTWAERCLHPRHLPLLPPLLSLALP